MYILEELKKVLNGLSGGWKINSQKTVLTFGGIIHGNIYISDYKTIKELKVAIDNYMHKYNFKRFHSSTNYQKPMNLYLESTKNVA